MRFLWVLQQAYLIMKTSASTFRAPNTPKCIMWFADLTGCKITSSVYRIPTCIFGIRIRPTRACNILSRCFALRMHQNELYDLQIPLDVERQVWCNVSWSSFCAIYPRPTQEWKILHQCFTSWTHQKALRDLHIQLDAKTQVWCNVSWRIFLGSARSPPNLEN
jgi:hypothetical protein